MDLAREVHESVIQRLFGIQLVFSSQAELSPAARERIGAELQAALFDLRRALQRPLAPPGAGDPHDAAGGGRAAAQGAPRPAPDAARRQRARRDPAARSSRSPSPCSPRPSATRTSTPGRPRSRSASRSRTTTRSCSTSSTTASAASARQSGMGLKLAALEALQFGGIVEFGEREPGQLARPTGGAA